MVEIGYELSLEDIEYLLEQWGAIGTSYEQYMRTEQQYLLGLESYLPVVLRCTQTRRVIGVGSAAFITEAFHDYVVGTAHPHVLNHAMSWVAQGKQPFLSERDVVRFNRSPGLDLLLVNYGVWPTDTMTRGSLFVQLVEAHVEEYSGFRIRRVLGEPTSDLFYEHMLRQGYRVVNDYGRGESGPPALLAIAADEALRGHDFYLAKLFHYFEPRCGFRGGHQQLLIEALRGGTDEDLAARLMISAETVKQRWRAIYDKIDAAVPGALPSGGELRRSRERRRAAVEFVRRHREELRPTISGVRRRPAHK